MRILVCGGRTYDDHVRVNQILDKLHLLHEVTELCHGGARGADELARRWAHEHAIKSVEYPADWKKYGKRAGFLRNQWMHDDFKPDLVVAFPGGPGTAMMLSIADGMGTETYTVPDFIIGGD